MTLAFVKGSTYECSGGNKPFLRACPGHVLLTGGLRGHSHVDPFDTRTKKGAINGFYYKAYAII